MKKLYIYDYEDSHDFDRADLLVLNDEADLKAQVEAYFRQAEYCDDETGELWATNIRVHEVAAVAVDGTEYDITLMPRQPKQENQ